MLVRRGAVVAEGAWIPYRIDLPHMLFSLSKSFTSAAVGLAVAEGRLGVDDPVLRFFPRKNPRRPSSNLEAMRLRHLLAMNTGHDQDARGCLDTGDPVKAFLALPVEHEPGSHFVYNNGATFMLSAIVQELTGRRVSEYLRPRLFEPLGIVGQRWEAHPRGIDFGAFGLNLKIEDIARFGQLLLKKGRWEDGEVLSPSWIEAATAKVSENASAESPDPSSDWQQGYGFQFWRCRHGAYRGDGAFGQFCIVMPKEEAVLAVFAGTADMQLTLDLVWEHLLLGLRDEALPAGGTSAAELREYLAGLRLRPPEGKAAPSASASSLSRAYRLGRNLAGLERLAFHFGPDELELQYRITRHNARLGEARRSTPGGFPQAYGDFRLRCGYGSWRPNLANLDGRGMRSCSCSGAWTAPASFSMKSAAVETPFVTTLDFRFEGEALRVEARDNVGFGPTEFPPIEGRAI
jgi:CubicO group peptidase (beta-lactamase class C family)